MRILCVSISLPVTAWGEGSFASRRFREATDVERKFHVMHLSAAFLNLWEFNPHMRILCVSISLPVTAWGEGSFASRRFREAADEERKFHVTHLSAALLNPWEFNQHK
jgi:hypothetical protein